MKNDYNAESIEIVSDINHVRLRKGMYIGESYNPNHLFSEIFDNALDEDMSGFTTNPVDIVVDYDNNEYTIRDYGRGLPQGNKILEDGSSKNVIDLIFTELKSGGKFNSDSYKISSGLHGMGSCVVNALSKYLSVSSIRENIETHVYEYGKEIHHSICKNDHNLKFGTKVSFIPDEDMFDSDRISIDFIVNRCKIASAFGYKSNIKLIDNNKETNINTESTMKDLIVEDNQITEYCSFNGEAVDDESGESIKYSFWYTNDTSCRSRAYTNLLPNSQGGTHVNIFCIAFEKAWSKYKIDGILNKDLYLGMRFVVSAFIANTEFNSQTKDKLVIKKKELEKFIDPLSESIYNCLINYDQSVIKGLIKRFQEHRASQNKLMARKEIRDIVVVSKETDGTVKRKSVVSKLMECTSKDRSDSEVHIVEGDSAAGPLITSRDISTQAILPIRGKILNVSRFGSEILKCLGNEEVKSIVNSAGTGILDDCDISRSRYERYIIDTDADDDGKQIQSLVTAVFVNLLPNIVKAGMLYVSVPPLYGWYEDVKVSRKRERIFKFGNNRDEIPNGIKFERFKGLGQMNPNEIYDTILNKDKRTLLRVEYPDNIDYFNEILTSSSVKYEILYDLGIIRYI